MRRRQGHYRVFVRSWWTPNPKYPQGLEPSPGKQKTIAWTETESDAQNIAQVYNKTHNPGRLSRKAEYTSQW
jgi:hypothetical protein